MYQQVSTHEMSQKNLSFANIIPFNSMSLMYDCKYIRIYAYSFIYVSIYLAGMENPPPPLAPSN